MVAIATEAWAAVGCHHAAHELPVQPRHHLPKAKKTDSFRGVHCTGQDDRQQGGAAAVVGRRGGLASCLLAALALSCSSAARAAVLEADDDVELLERVKEDRKKRLQKQGIISSSSTETGYLQELIYKLSKVGQAIDKNDLSAASTVLGPNADAQWVQNINAAFSKFSSSPEEKSEVDNFNSSLASLFTSVDKRDVESSKSAFVSSATALQKWIGLAGLGAQLKGL